MATDATTQKPNHFEVTTQQGDAYCQYVDFDVDGDGTVERCLAIQLVDGGRGLHLVAGSDEEKAFRKRHPEVKDPNAPAQDAGADDAAHQDV